MGQDGVFVDDVVDAVFVEVVTENRELTLILTRMHGCTGRGPRIWAIPTDIKILDKKMGFS
jgi:hypothetical protein